jgi:hypothetical protein
MGTDRKTDLSIQCNNRWWQGVGWTCRHLAHHVSSPPAAGASVAVLIEHLKQRALFDGWMIARCMTQDAKAPAS